MLNGLTQPSLNPDITDELIRASFCLTGGLSPISPGKFKHPTNFCRGSEGLGNKILPLIYVPDLGLNCQVFIHPLRFFSPASGMLLLK